jgi:hypothetical protein
MKLLSEDLSKVSVNLNPRFIISSKEHGNTLGELYVAKITCASCNGLETCPIKGIIPFIDINASNYYKTLTLTYKPCQLLNKQTHVNEIKNRLLRSMLSDLYYFPEQNMVLTWKDTVLALSPIITKSMLMFTDIISTSGILNGTSLGKRGIYIAHQPGTLSFLSCLTRGVIELGYEATYIHMPMAAYANKYNISMLHNVCGAANWLFLDLWDRVLGDGSLHSAMVDIINYRRSNGLFTVLSMVVEPERRILRSTLEKFILSEAESKKGFWIKERRHRKVVNSD